MASERKPSIYSDRGTIGSSDELDEYGVWVKSEPQDLSSVSVGSQDSAEPAIPAIEELPDFNTDFDGEETSGFGQDDFEIPDLDIPDDAKLSGSDSTGQEADSLDFDDLSIPEESPGESVTEAGFTEVSMDDFLDDSPELAEEPAVLPVEEPTALDTGADEAAAPAPSPRKSGGADLSTQLLMKIADELSSIRTELSTLKKEFSTIRQGVPEADDKGDAQKKGFFDEEEDEKISLTGDELDNILNTADFTEEAGADATEELPGAYPSTEGEGLMPSGSFQVVDEEALPDLLSDQDDIISADIEEQPGEEAPAEEGPSLLEYEDEEIEGENPEEDDIVIDIDFDGIDPEALTEDRSLELETTPDGKISLDFGTQDFDIPLNGLPGGEGSGKGFNDPSPADEIAGEGFDISLDEKDSEELRQLREEGAKPMTPAPEDTSYLDEEPVETAAEPAGEISGEISIDDFPLDEFPLEEPALDESAVDGPADEIALDEFPLGEPALDESAADSVDEITFDENPLDDNALGDLGEIDLDDSIDLSGAVIDEPDLSAEISENPVEEPSLEDLSLDDELGGISIDMDMEEASPAGNISIEEDAELPAEEPAAEHEEELAIPVLGDDTDFDIPGEVPATGGSAPEEESFAEVIPEGFEIEPGNSDNPLDDDLEEDVLSEGDIDTLEKISEPLDIEPAADTAGEEASIPDDEGLNIPNDIKQELKTVLSYMDQLLESLPEDKIEEFAKSEYFDTYKKLFKELGLV
jgi:hypothetical protein